MRGGTLIVLLFAPSAAAAAGLYLAPPGVRSLARGGAFVAGAEGAMALGYNPAGLHAGADSGCIDLIAPVFNTDYTRSVGGRPEPTVRGRAVSPMVPSLGIAHDLGLHDDLRFGLAFLSDVPALQSWPSSLADGSPAPQRYALHDFRGSAVTKLSVGAAYRVSDWLTAGASFQLVTGVLSAEATFSTCDGVICTLPEDPDFDAVARITSGVLYAPGTQLGIIVTPEPFLRVGLSWESGYVIEDDAARLELRLPAAAAFDNAHLDPAEPTVGVATELPMRLRGGIELRRDTLRLEAAFIWEPWSAHDGIDIDSSNIVMHDVTGVGDYRGSEIRIERGFADTWSARLGGELGLDLTYPAELRAGIAYEPSAIPDDRLSPLTVDLDKLLLSLGIGVDVGAVQLDAGYAYVHMQERTIVASRVKQVSPTRPAYAGATTVGEGSYRAAAHLFGLAASYRF